jgi:RNA polymerase sigma-70 factor (ECF subfamily)
LNQVSDSESPGAADVARLSDEELMRRFDHREDQAVVGELMRRYAPELARYLRRFVDANTAEDLVQLTLLKLSEKRRLYRPGRALRPWLYGIATHLAIDSWRKSRRRRERSLEATPGDDCDRLALRESLGEESISPEESVADQETRELVFAAVQRLPEHLRSVVMLVHFQGLKYTEAADALHVPIGTIKSRLFQARNLLRQCSIRTQDV